MKNFLLTAAAAVAFFTRLPIHRLVIPPKERFSHVLPFASFAGLVVGLFSALTWWLTSMVVPSFMSVLLTVILTVLFTGALHEDGFADFVDGFGGGYTKDKILVIMKDSHIGTYGVISLVLLFAVRLGLLMSFNPNIMVGAIVTGAVVGRFIGGLLPNFLQYARTIEASKIQVGLVPMSFWQILINLILIVALGYYFFGWMCVVYLAASAIPLLLLVPYLRYKIGGYTGDCCGMLIVTAELVWLFAICIR